MAEINRQANPFPGLRPFESNETHLFFGRDGQSEALLRRLKRTRFLAVVGTSGSGKSSLVRAGLLPALQGGLMSSAGSDWRIAIIRPGDDPIGELAKSLASPNVLGTPGEDEDDMQAVLAETTLRRSSRGLVELVSRARAKLGAEGQPLFDEYENLLVVVDQFEELFRFKQLIEKGHTREDAAAFVKLLLEAVRQKEEKIYVVLTMRSDFLGDCAQFRELPEAINDGQYLIPRMTRDERREAITGPVAVGEGAISEPLVNQLLNDVGDNPDQLPIMQHALMRTWDYWLGHRRNGRAMDIPDYEAIGGMSEALSLHADEAYAELTDAQKLIAEKLFKGLTERGADNREVRRPMEVAEICELTGASAAAVIAVVEVFRRSGRSFLMPPPTDALTGAPISLTRESLIDISHESLIRNWERLKKWVEEESRSARIYRRLAETAVLHHEGGAGLWRDPDLQVALTWREGGSPNEVWARRYHPEFASAMSFLDASVTARDAQLAAEEASRRKEIKRTRLTALIFGVAFIFSLAMGVYAYRQKNEAQIQQVEALIAKDAAIRANSETERALQQAKADNEAAKLANIGMMEARKAAEEREQDALEARKETEAALAQAKQKNEEAARANIAMRAAQLKAVERAKAAEAATLRAKEETIKNVKAKEANDKFREATALAQRGRFGDAEGILKAAVAGYRDPYVNNEEAVADTYVELAHNRFTTAYKNFNELDRGKKYDYSIYGIEMSRDYYEEAAKIYASPPVNAPEKAATALFSLGMMLMKFTKSKDAIHTTGIGLADLSTWDMLDEDVPELSLFPVKLGAPPVRPQDEDPQVKFERQSVGVFRRALTNYERAFDGYTNDTSKSLEEREALRKSAREGMEKSAYQAANYYRNKASELDAQTPPSEAEPLEKWRVQIMENNRQAAHFFKKLLELRSAGNDIEVGNLLVWLGGLYFDLNDRPTSEAYFGRVLAAYEKASNGMGRAESLASIAATLDQAGQVKPAFDLMERARVEYKSNGNLLGQAEMSYKHGRILEEQIDKEWSSLAPDKYKQSLETYGLIRNLDEAGRADNLFYMGDFWEKNGDYQLALKALRLAAAISAHLHQNNEFFVDDEARAHDEVASVLSLMGQTREAIEEYERAHALYLKASSIFRPDPQRSKSALVNSKRVSRIIAALKAALNQPRPAAAAKGSS